MAEPEEKLCVFWFRRDLRLDDNAGMYHALHSEYRVLPVFIFDKEILSKLENKNDRRVQFIHRQINILNRQLNEYGSSLKVFFDKPEFAFKELTKQYNVATVYLNEDYEPYAIQRDISVRQVLENKGITMHSYKDQCVYAKEDILKSDGSPYTVFTPYMNKWREKFSWEDLQAFDCSSLYHRFYPLPAEEIPYLDSIGFNYNKFNFPTSEVDPLVLKNYAGARDFPALAGTSKLGLHLRLGTVSIREVLRKSIEVSEVFSNELIWREFFMMILYHFPNVVSEPFKKKYSRIPWRHAPDEFERWCAGQTGFALVDAGMRELNASGFMHNRVRMVAASFLCKHLLIDWRLGESYFASHLLDYELSSNNGNWQWVAGCGCDAAPYFRIFNPHTQATKFDPAGEYIKKWVPEYESSSYEKMQMISHSEARDRCLSTFKKALAGI